MGCLFSGSIADRIGRRRSFQLSALPMIVGAALRLINHMVCICVFFLSCYHALSTCSCCHGRGMYYGFSLTWSDLMDVPVIYQNSTKEKSLLLATNIVGASWFISVQDKHENLFHLMFYHILNSKYLNTCLLSPL
jgi:MFS family permease